MKLEQRILYALAGNTQFNCISTHCRCCSYESDHACNHFQSACARYISGNLTIQWTSLDVPKSLVWVLMRHSLIWFCPSANDFPWTVEKHQPLLSLEGKLQYCGSWSCLVHNLCIASLICVMCLQIIFCHTISLCSAKIHAPPLASNWNKGPESRGNWESVGTSRHIIHCNTSPTVTAVRSDWEGSLGSKSSICPPRVNQFGPINLIIVSRKKPPKSPPGLYCPHKTYSYPHTVTPPSRTRWTVLSIMLCVPGATRSKVPFNLFMFRLLDWCLKF